MTLLLSCVISASASALAQEASAQEHTSATTTTAQTSDVAATTKAKPPALTKRAARASKTNAAEESARRAAKSAKEKTGDVVLLSEATGDMSSASMSSASRRKRSASSRASSVEVAMQQTGTTTTTPVVPAPSSNQTTQQPVTTGPTTGTTTTTPTTPPQSQTVQQPTTTGATQTPPTSAPVVNPSQSQDANIQAPQGVTPPAGRGATVAPPQGVREPGRESVPAAAPSDVELNVPPVAADFRTEPAPFPALQRVGVEMSNQRSLSVREAIEMALANNKDIEVARQNVRAAEFDLQASLGVYDPRFATFSYYERSETPAASFLAGGAGGAVVQSGFFNTASFQGLVPKGGGGYRVDFTSNRVTSNNQFASLNPQYPSSLTFNFTQPLLRGRSFDQNRRLIEIGKRNLSLTDAQFRQRAIETITNVQRAYWDLVFALRNLQIQRDAVRDARAQLEHNRRLVAEGMLAPIDVVAAEAQVSGFEQSVYSALDDVGRAENVLKNLIAENSESPLWNVAIVPTDEVDLAVPPIALGEAMDSAIKNRPELQQSDIARSINEVEQRFAREQTKRQVDLVGSYGVVGLAGSLNSSASNVLTGQTTVLRERINELTTAINRLTGSQLNLLPAPPQQTFPEVLVGGYPQSLTNLAANRFNNFRVGVQVNFPLHNRTAEAQLGRTLVERDRINVQREQLEQLIQVDVRNALQLVKTAESRLRAAATARSASEQQYASEQRKFDAGQSTFFLVLERQTALTTARGNELRAQTELNKAIAELQRATGNALAANRVEVQIR